MSADFTHLDNREHPRMVDVSHKAITERKAVAQAVVRLGEELFELLKEEGEYIQRTGFSNRYHCRYSRG